MYVCVCVARYLVERSPLWPIVIRKLFAQLSLNPYSVHGGSKSKEEGGVVGGKRAARGKEKKEEKQRPDKVSPPSSPPTQPMK